MQPDILYQDQDILVLNKPAGVVVNQAQSVAEPTIQSWMQDFLLSQPELPQAEWEQQVPADFDNSFGSPMEIFLQRLGMVHRLDKQTSGVLLLAKHPGSLVHLLAQFRERTVQKEYLALVHGQMATASGVIDAPLGRSSRDRKKFAVVPGGRPAVTTYQVEKWFQGFAPAASHHSHLEVAKELAKSERLYQGFSLVRCFPKTGRTHQIRVHLAHLQHPLVGDTTYGGKKRQKLDPVWCPRHFLHAAVIEFIHPRTNQVLKVEAPLTDDLQSVLTLLH